MTLPVSIDWTGLIRRLCLEPATAVRSLLERPEPALGITLLTLAFLFEALGDVIWWRTQPYATFGLRFPFLGWFGWAINHGFWVWGLLTAAVHHGSRLRWAAFLNAYAPLVLLPTLLGAIVQATPAAIDSIPADGYYITSLIRYVGLFVIAGSVVAGDENTTFRFLIRAGLYPALAGALWGILEYVIRQGLA